MICIFGGLNSLEITTSHCGLYSVEWPSTMWNGPGPVTQLKTAIQEVLCRDTGRRSFFLQSTSSQQFRFGFVADLFMRLSRYNRIVLSILSTLLEAEEVLPYCSGRT